MDRYLERLQAELALSLDGLDGIQTQLHPANDPDRWSVQQIVGHLRLTYMATIDAMEARIAKGAPTKAKPSLVQNVAQFTLIWIGYFPRGRKAPERVTAAKDESPASGRSLLTGLETALSLMDTKIDDAGALFGNHRRVISHMVLGPQSVEQWRKFHLIHGRHHIRQIKAVRSLYRI